MFGMTQQQYSRFENGVFELNYELIIRLCALYEITPNELFTVESIGKGRAILDCPPLLSPRRLPLSAVEITGNR